MELRISASELRLEGAGTHFTVTKAFIAFFYEDLRYHEMAVG